MKPVCSIFFLCCIGVSFSAGQKIDGGVLNRWVGGDWVAEGTFVDSDFSKPMKVSANTTCAWSPNRMFVVCDQNVKTNDKPGQQVSLYGYDSQANKFHFYGLSPTGEKPRSLDLLISENGNHWEYANTEDVAGKPVRFRTVNIFHDADHVEWWTEYSKDDGSHWSRMGVGTESRQK